MLATMKQVKFQNRNRSADKTLDDSLRLATSLPPTLVLIQEE